MPVTRGIPVGRAVVGFVAVLAALVIGVGAHTVLAAQEAASGEAPEGPAHASVSFVAVGDNLPDNYIGYYADSLAGEPGDGRYDYGPMLAPVAPYIQKADLAYIDQETHVGGSELGVQGYPSFNTTDEMADAVVNAGFDLVASATNHSYDWGYFGALEHSLSVWETKPVAFTGTATSEEQHRRIATAEREGITFALLNYTYGVNGYAQDELPPYAVNFIDDARIAVDVGRAHEVADVVLVSMHWGTELLEEADEEQRRLAQLLADLDVDVVIGSHPHVIGPMEWVANSNGEGHETLVAYSLGNFLADHEAPLASNLLEGMLTCDFVQQEEGGDIRVANVRWEPLVCHSNNNRTGFAVYAVKDYTRELAAECRCLSEMDDPLGWLNQHTREVVGEKWFDTMG